MNNKELKNIAKKIYKGIDKDCNYNIKPTLSLCFKIVKEDFKENMNEKDLFEKSKISINLIMYGY